MIVAGQQQQQQQQQQRVFMTMRAAVAAAPVCAGLLYSIASTTSGRTVAALLTAVWVALSLHAVWAELPSRLGASSAVAMSSFAPQLLLP
jgi:hypothetical protein